MKRLPGGVGFYLWRLSQAIMALENSAPETFADLKTAGGRHNFRNEVRNVEYLFKRFIKAHDAAEPDESLKIGRLGRDAE